MITELILNMKIIPAGLRKISKGGDRYKIRLPMNLNYIWEELHKKGVKVKVYLEIDSQQTQ